GSGSSRDRARVSCQYVQIVGRRDDPWPPRSLRWRRPLEKGGVAPRFAGAWVVLCQPWHRKFLWIVAAGPLSTASKLLHLEVTVSARSGDPEQKQKRSGCRDGVISLVFPWDDGGIHAELACSQRLVGALDGSSGGHATTWRVSFFRKHPSFK